MNSHERLESLPDRRSWNARRNEEVPVFGRNDLPYADYVEKLDLYHGKGDEVFFIDDELPPDQMDLRDYRLWKDGRRR